MGPRSGPRSARRCPSRPPSSCPRARTPSASPSLSASSTRCSTRGWSAATSSSRSAAGVVGDLAGFAAAILRRGMRLRPDAHQPAGPGRFLGRRQDRHQHPPRQEPRRRLPPAGARARRHPAFSTRCADASSAAGYAEVAKYGLIDDPAFFAWLEGHWRESSAGGPARDPRRSRRAAVPRRASSPPTRREAGRAGAAQSRATPSPTRWRPRPASPTVSFTARPWRSAWRWPSASPPNSAIAMPLRRPRVSASSGRRRLADPDFPDRRQHSRRRPPDGTHRPGQEGRARRAHLHPGARIGRAFVARDVPADSVRSFLETRIER